MAETSRSFFRTGLGKVVLFGGGGLVLLAGGVVLLGPTVASSFAPGIIQSTANAQISGSVKVGAVSLSWFGPISVSGVELLDEAGKPVAKVDLVSDLGILSVLGGIGDVGTLKVSGRADLRAVTDASGAVKTNLERAIAPKTPATPAAGGTSGGGGGVPGTLRAKVEITGIDVTYVETDAGGKTSAEAAIRGLKGTVTASMAGGGSAQIDLTAGFAEGSGAATGGGAAGGTLAVNSTVDGLLDSAGKVAVAGMKTKTTVKASGVPVRLIDALAQQQGLLVEALGDSLAVDAEVNGGLKDATVVVNVQAPRATVNAALRAANDRLTATGPVTAEVRSTRFVERLGNLKTTLADAGISISTWPSAKVTVTGLNVPMSGSADLRGSGAQVMLELSELTGAARLPNQPERALTVAPLRLTVNAADLGGPVSVQGGTSANLGGASAGTLSVAATASGLLDGQGRPAAVAAMNVQGEAKVTGLSAELLDPVLKGMNLPLVVKDDIGPSMDVTVKAETATGSSDRAVTLSVASANVNVEAPMVIRATEIATVRPVSVKVNSASGLAGRLAGDAVKLSGRGVVEAQATLRVPTTGGKPDMNAVTAQVSAVVTDVAARLAADQDAVEVTRLTTTLGLNPGQPVDVKVDGQLRHRGVPASLSADMKVAGALGTKVTPALPGLDGMRLNGQAAVTGVPFALVNQFAQLSGVTLEAAEMLYGQAAGVTVGLRTGSAGEQVVSANLSAGGLRTATAEAALKPTSLAVSGVTIEADMPADRLTALLRNAGLSAESLPNFAVTEAVRPKVTVGAFEVPLKTANGVVTLAPDFAKGSGEVGVEVGMEKVAVRGLMRDKPTQSHGVNGLKLAARAPVASLGGTPTVNFTLGGDVLQDGAVAGKLSGRGGTTAGGGLNADVQLADVPTALLDGLAGRPMLVSGAAGEKLTVTAKAARTGEGAPLEATVAVDSPRLKVSEVAVRTSADRLSVSKPVTVELDATAEWLNRFAMGGESLPAGQSPDLAVVGNTKITLNLQSLTLSTGGSEPDAGPARPGVFALAATASVPKITMERRTTGADGKPGKVQSEISGTSVEIGTQNDGRAVSLKAAVTRVAEGGAATGEPLRLDALLSGFAGANGKIATDGAVVDLTLKAGKVPTALIDALAGGMDLPRILGPELAADVALRQFSKTGTSGSLSANLRTARSLVDVAGPISGGVLSVGGQGGPGGQSGRPLRLELSEFTYGVDTTFLEVLPLFAEVSRKAGERPSAISSTNLRLPIDGDLRKLNGTIRVDMGQVQYTFARELGEILDNTIFTQDSAASQRPIAPFDITITNGVLRYDRFEIPVRNFFMRTEGTVDLVNKRIDVITYIPTVALSPGLAERLNNQVAGALRGVMPNLISEATMIPLRTRGPMSKPTRELDFQAFIDNLGREVIKSPENLIDAIGNLIDREKDRKDGKDGKKTPAQPARPTNPPKQPGKK